MVLNKQSNIFWHQEQVTKLDRENLLGQKTVVLWFTGLSGSGKSTLANYVAKRLHSLGKLAYVLDGDNIRHGLNQDLGFSPADRRENIRRIGEVAKLFIDAGVITLAAVVYPFKQDREDLKRLLGADFVEIFVDCSQAVCEARDPKKLYAKARSGDIKDFTGITAPYERPDQPQLVLETDKESVERCVEKVLQYLINHNLLGE